MRLFTFQAAYSAYWSIKHCKDLRKVKNLYHRSPRSNTEKNTKGGTVSAKVRILLEMPRRKQEKLPLYDEYENESEIIIVDESEEEVEAYKLHSYGCGVDCHSKISSYPSIFQETEDFTNGTKRLPILGTLCLPQKNGLSIGYRHFPIQFPICPCRSTIQSKQQQHITCRFFWPGKESLPSSILRWPELRRGRLTNLMLDAYRITILPVFGLNHFRFLQIFMNFESLSQPVKVMTEMRLEQETESTISLPASDLL